jgi:hypothetical protein
MSLPLIFRELGSRPQPPSERAIGRSMILGREGKPYVEIATLPRPFARRADNAAVQFDREADSLDRRGR